MSRRLIVGLMSGTSLDGVDAVLAEFSASGIRSLGAHHVSMPDGLRKQLHELQAPSVDELAHSYLAANDIAKLYAQCTLELLEQHKLSSKDIACLGAHGQTVRHQPQSAYTAQLLNAALLSELTGIAVAYDFRARDVAAGGQGAPLVPAFHADIFSDANSTRAVINIGGIANISVLPATNFERPVSGFDCGPGNALLDHWCEKHRGTRFDQNGAWAASGNCNSELLALLLAHPFFKKTPPKSTGRDDFHPQWLSDRLREFHRLGDAQQGISAVDVQRTLLELTAASIARDCITHSVQEVFLCGGGALNLSLVAAIQRSLNVRVETTEALGVPVDQVEALAFAWLANKRLLLLPGNLTEVTGARGLRVLGSLTGG